MSGFEGDNPSQAGKHVNIVLVPGGGNSRCTHIRSFPLADTLAYSSVQVPFAKAYTGPLHSINNYLLDLDATQPLNDPTDKSTFTNEY
jgi:hypothetical protein